MTDSARLSEETKAEQKPVVLVVEDEVLIRLNVAEYLRAVGFEVIEAVDAPEAVAIITARFHVDLVFTDLNMPGPMDGVMLAMWVTDYAGIPALLTSGGVHFERWSGRFPPERFVPKPYTMEQVESRIREELSAREGLPSVLVLEDDDVERYTMERVLQKAGYQVHVAKDGLAANIKLASNKIDLMLADIALGREVNGLEVARGAGRQYPALKVVFLTAYDVPSGLNSDIKVLRKPIAPDKLILEVQSALGVAQQQ